MMTPRPLRWFLTITLVALVGLASATVLAASTQDQDCQGTSSEERAQRVSAVLDDYFDDLDATPEQQVRIRTIVESLTPKAESARARRAPLARELGDQLLSGKPDAERVHVLINQMSSISMDFASEATGAALKVHAVLTPEQRAGLAEDFEMPRRDFQGSWFLDRALDRGLSRIDATDAQRALAEKHKNELLGKVGTLVSQQYDARDALLKALRSDKPSAKAVQTIVDRSGVQLTAFAHDAAESLVEFARTLTPEQRQQIRKRVEAHRAERCS